MGQLRHFRIQVHKLHICVVGLLLGQLEIFRDRVFQWNGHEKEVGNEAIVAEKLHFIIWPYYCKPILDSDGALI